MAETAGLVVGVAAGLVLVVYGLVALIKAKSPRS